MSWDSRGKSSRIHKTRNLCRSARLSEIKSRLQRSFGRHDTTLGLLVLRVRSRLRLCLPASFSSR